MNFNRWLFRPLSIVALWCCAVVSFCADNAEKSVPGKPAMVWSFADGLQGWLPQNWESIEFGPNGLHGKTAYDCQLLSPVLNINADDYGVLSVCLRSDTPGRGEIFINSPGEGMSDKRKISHTLNSDPTFFIHRTELRGNPYWHGVIERIRYDALNAAGADVAVQFIALLPDADSVLINGDAEMLVDGVPYSWHPVSQSNRSPGLTDETPLSGKRALHLPSGTGWETDSIDLSFLNDMTVEGYMRGSGCELRISAVFATVDGVNLAPQTVTKQTTQPSWGPFTWSFSPPDMAASVVVRFECISRDGAIDIDAVRCERGARRAIVDVPHQGPTWHAAWIWHRKVLEQDNCTVFMRKRFTCTTAAPKLAQLQITADDGYIATLNGKEIGRTIGEEDGWRTPELIDVTTLITSEENELLVEAHDVRSAQGLIAELLIVDPQGKEQSITSGPDWEASLERGGPWEPAHVLGRPPCSPWGALSYRPMGVLPAVALKVTPQAPASNQGSVVVNVQLDSASPVRHSVYLAAVLKKGDEILRRIPCPKAFFANSVPAEGKDTLEAWSLPGLFGATGALTWEFEITGAVAEDSLPTIQVHTAEPAESQGFPLARIDVRKRVPYLTVNGENVDPTQSLFLHPDHLHQQNAVPTGVPIWSVALDDMGFKKDGFDYTEVDQKLSRYLTENPKAWLIPTFTFDTRYQRWWLEAHPEARCRHEDGGDVIGDYHGGRRIVPSYGSTVWREAYAHALRMLLRHLKTSPFASRIIGFHPASGISWEWFHWGSQSGELVDYSDAGKEDFRRWLREKYQTDEALRNAWYREDVTLSSATVPSEARRRKPANGIFYDPATQQDILDYHRYQHDVVADTIRCFGRIVKEETEGRALYGTYYGYTMHLPESAGFCQGSGHFSLYRLLQAEEIDFFMAPVAYSWREVGGTAATMTVAESAALNGKLFWNQADLRSHWSHQAGHGRPPDLAGSITCMDRETARNLAHGTAIQWYDFSLGWTFGDARLCQEMKRLYDIDAVREKGDPWPRSDYLAVIVDERQMGTFDPFHPPYGLNLIYRQREALERAGIPWKAYLFSDLKTHPELLEHNAFLFLNLFRLDAAERAFLKQKVMQAGRTVMFVGPVGMLDGKGVDARNTGEFLGMDTIEAPSDLNLQATFLPSLPGPWAACSAKTYGIAHAFPPVAISKNKPDQILATFADQAPALVQVEHANSHVFWSVAPGLPTDALRSLASLAGVPVFCTSDDAVYAGHGVVGIHAHGNGPRTISVPGKGDMYELLGRTDFHLTATGLQIDLRHGETRIFTRR